MLNSPITLRDLEYIVELSKELHFGRASKNLHVSQPALSTQIKKAESLLGLTLFERDHKRVFLTESGRQILPLAQRVLDEAQNLFIKSTPKKTIPFGGHLSLGVIESLGSAFFKHIILPFKKTYPTCPLEPREGLTSDLIEQLSRGQLDAIVISPTIDLRSFESSPLFFESFHLAVNADSPLVHKTEFRTQDLDSKDLLLLKEGHCLKDQILNFCPKNRKGHVHKSHVASLETLKLLVSAGPHYTLIPELWIKKEDKALLGITYLPPSNIKIGREIVLVWRAQSSQALDMNRLAELIKKEIPLKSISHPV